MKLKELYEEIWTEKNVTCSDSFQSGTRTASALEVLPGGSSLIDVGCGRGDFLTKARSLYERVIGVDISATALTIARKRDLDVIRCDLNEKRLPFCDESFETVVSLDVVEHVLEPERFLKELARVTAPGGWIIVSTPNIRYVKHILTLLFRGRFPHTSQDRSGYDGGHLHYFTRKDICSLMSAAGTTPVRSIGIIPSQKLAFVRRFAEARPVIEWLSAGLLVLGKKHDPGTA